MKPDGHCRSCGAPIAWVITVKGRRMPLDPDPVEDGNVWIMRVEGAQLVAGVSLNAEGVPPLVRERYVSHFVTCPNADQHRKRGKS